MSIKLICIDMDGTLLMDQHNISEEDKSAIKYAIEKGVHVAITTGRVYNCAKLYSDLIGLTTPIIASNGAFIGGSHAKTFISCVVQSNVSFIVIYYLAYILPPINIILHLMLILLSIIIIRKFNPVNPLRKVIKTQYKKIKFKNIVTFTLLIWFVFSNLLLSNYYINCGLLIILYIILDFLKEVYKNEKKISS